MFFDIINTLRSLCMTTLGLMDKIHAKFLLILPCQIETEACSAGEQPVRDTFDQLTKKSKKGLSCG